MLSREKIKFKHMPTIDESPDLGLDGKGIRVAVVYKPSHNKAFFYRPPLSMTPYAKEVKTEEISAYNTKKMEL